MTLGDITVTPIAIPGHTPGSLAFIFPVKDGRRTHMAGLFGGTILTADRITTPGLKQYVQSIAHYLETAKRLKVDVELQNHPIFDMTPDRLARLKTRKAGRTASVHDRHGALRQVLVGGVGVHPGGDRSARLIT